MASKKGNQKIKKPRNLRMRKKKGKPPGTIIYVGHREGTTSSLNVLEYNKDLHQVNQEVTLSELSHLTKPGINLWIDVVGISDEEFIEKLGNKFKLNPLVMEDAINTHQRPKVDEYEDYIFGVFKMLYLNKDQQLVAEHLALVLFEDRVLVFQEMREDVFDDVRQRSLNPASRIRNRGVDYLFFALIDAVVDSYLEVVEHTFEKIEQLEEEVYNNPHPNIAHRIQDLKKEVIRLHKWIFPVKELVHRLIETENPLIKKDTKIFLRDALDHCVEVNENLQIYRELAISLMEMYMSNMSNKMNEVMKVLTIMASIFIPLTFIAGIYGMNFETMPELKWEYGYFVVLGLMLLILLGMLAYFKRKGWL